jgi:hypothetical protein
LPPLLEHEELCRAVLRNLCTSITFLQAKYT